jgi:hypothetical protein
MKVFFIVLVLIVTILLIYLKDCPHLEGFSATNSYDCVISINVHENTAFLLKQLDNIHKNVACTYMVILNCNDYMSYKLKTIKLPSNVYIHNISLNKRRDHGSLFHGIYNNMYFAVRNLKFKYFIVASSRNMFKNFLNITDLENLVDFTQFESSPNYLTKHKELTIDTVMILTPENAKRKSWWWPVIVSSQLGRYCLERNRNLYTSAHEGLVLKYETCAKIVNFLTNHPEMNMELYELNMPVEEFALQTLAKLLGDPFFYIGNGCCNEDVIPSNDLDSLDKRFMYKVKRI